MINNAFHHTHHPITCMINNAFHHTHHPSARSARYTTRRHGLSVYLGVPRMDNIHVQRIEKTRNVHVRPRKTPRSTLALLEDDRYQVNMVAPARPEDLAHYFDKKKAALPPQFRGYRHQLAANRSVKSAAHGRRCVRPPSSSSSSRPNSSYSVNNRKRKTSYAKNSNNLAYNKLKARMEEQVAINKIQQEKILFLENKIGSLQSKLLIERGENDHLKKLVEDTAETNAMADAYLRKLLESHNSQLPQS